MEEEGKGGRKRRRKGLERKMGEERKLEINEEGRKGNDGGRRRARMEGGIRKERNKSEPKKMD